MVSDPLEQFKSLIIASTGVYEHEKAESDDLDRLLGFNVQGVEARVRSREQNAMSPSPQSWSHLSPQVFQTPYAEFYRVLLELSPASGDLVVDLGAGYCRMAFVIEAFFPGVSFLGYELSSERVEEAKRVMESHGLISSLVLLQDLEAPQSRPKLAKHYFLYDFGSPAAIEKSLQDLKAIASEGTIQVAARGRRSRDAIERGHPWLSQVNTPRHFAHYSIYRS